MIRYNLLNSYNIIKTQVLLFLRNFLIKLNEKLKTEVLNIKEITNLTVEGTWNGRLSVDFF